MFEISKLVKVVPVRVLVLKNVDQNTVFVLFAKEPYFSRLLAKEKEIPVRACGVCIVFFVCACFLASF